MKRFLTIASLVALCMCLVLPLAACNNTTAEAKVMTMELNPQVEFIIDTDNKIVSVNALNEDGNLILSAQTDGKKFVGQTPEAAAELYVDYCEDLGFFVKGEAKSGENELKISYSGAQAEADMKAMAEKIDNYIKTEYKNISASVSNGAKIADEYLQAQLKKAMPYLTDAALKAMNKVEALAESRKETAEMYSQAVKDAYYKAKEAALRQENFDAVKATMSSANQLAFAGVELGYKTATATIATIRDMWLTGENSAYQIALKAFQQAKTEYLNYRNYLRENNIDEGADYTRIENAYKDAAAALDSAYTRFNAALDEAQKTIDQKYDEVVAWLTQKNVDFNKAVDDAQETINANMAKFETQFAKDYQSAIDSAKQGWADMKEKLEKGYQTGEESQN